MKETHGRFATTLSITVLLSACSPYIYKNEVKSFSDGVDQAVGAFNGLHDRVRTVYTDDSLDALAENGTALGTNDDCTAATTYTVGQGPGVLVADTRCLAAWSAWRNTQPDRRGEKPDCPNASPDIRDGKLTFYDIESVGKAEMNRCVLGVRIPPGRIDPTPLTEAETLLVETPKLLPALRAYADALAGIAGAEDRETLESAVADAKQALGGLAGKVDEFKKDDQKTLQTSVGLISDLVGAALIAGLDYRRYKALQNVTANADPVIQQAAMLLSQVSMPMVTIELQSAGRDYLSKVADTNGTTDQAWRDAYAEARQARETYVMMYRSSPTSVFKSMAAAHSKLKEALHDRRMQRDALQESLQDFVAKAQSAYDTFTK